MVAFVDLAALDLPHRSHPWSRSSTSLRSIFLTAQ